MTWDPPTDAELASGKPITTGKAQRIRDLTASAFAAEAGAPRATSRIITPGGAAIDGTLINATTITLPGALEWSALNRTATDLSLPWYTLQRVDGDSILTGININIDGVDDAAWLVGKNALGLAAGQPSRYTYPGSGSLYGGPGGSAQGSGGRGGPSSVSLPYVGEAFGYLDGSAFNRAASLIRGAIGGYAYYDDSVNVTLSKGGGCLVIYVKGDLDLTGTTINANGETPGIHTGAGGGAGGSIIIVCTGTLTGGTFNAKGGDGSNDSSRGGGGAGGFVWLIAQALAGTQTYDTSGGAATTTGLAGAAGSHGSYTYTEGQINSLLLR